MSVRRSAILARQLAPCRLLTPYCAVLQQSLHIRSFTSTCPAFAHAPRLKPKKVYEPYETATEGNQYHRKPVNIPPSVDVWIESAERPGCHRIFIEGPRSSKKIFVPEYLAVNLRYHEPADIETQPNTVALELSGEGPYDERITRKKIREVWRASRGDLQKWVKGCKEGHDVFFATGKGHLGTPNATWDEDKRELMLDIDGNTRTWNLPEDGIVEMLKKGFTLNSADADALRTINIEIKAWKKVQTKKLLDAQAAVKNKQWKAEREVEMAQREVWAATKRERRAEDKERKIRSRGEEAARSREWENRKPGMSHEPGSNSSVYRPFKQVEEKPRRGWW